MQNTKLSRILRQDEDNHCISFCSSMSKMMETTIWPNMSMNPQGFYSKYQFTIILKFSFITVLCAAIWMTGWFCCDEQKILSYNRIFNKCLMTPPNVLNVSNYFKDFYNVWYWQINILWYSKYKIRKFRENWINLVASFAKVTKDHLLFVKVEATGVIYCRLLPFPFDESIHVIYSENFNYIYWKIWDEFISKKYKEI